MTEERDPKVSLRYRELGTEEPPRELDQAILAAAHRAADKPHAPLVAPAGRHRWYFAFGAVAILVLAVAITVQVDRQPDPEALPPTTASVPSDRADEFSSQAEKESKARAELSKQLADAAPPPARERRNAPAQPAAPAASPPAEAKPQAAEVARADRLEPQLEQAPSVQMQSAPAAAPATPTPSQAGNRDQSSAAAAGMLLARPEAKMEQNRAVASAASALNPEQLLERIAELRQQGKHEEADKALAEFRRRYPEYRISDEMLKKVERPK
jgi:hypothetical protein